MVIEFNDEDNGCHFYYHLIVVHLCRFSKMDLGNRAVGVTTMQHII